MIYKIFKDSAELQKKILIILQSLNDSYVPDAYDELLTQAEIQGHINSINGMVLTYTLVSIIKLKPLIGFDYIL